MEANIPMQFGGYDFEVICQIVPDNDENGDIALFQPQDGYDNPRGLPLHPYGDGDFCTIQIPCDHNRAGVYVIAGANDQGPLYVGRCVNLSQRFNCGYGQIAPRNCYQGGQQTNCRINQAVLAAVEAGEQLTLYFREIEDAADRASIERELIIRPPWNRG